jgi:hypothetical protein
VSESETEIEEDPSSVDRELSLSELPEEELSELPESEEDLELSELPESEEESWELSELPEEEDITEGWEESEELEDVCSCSHHSTTYKSPHISWVTNITVSGHGPMLAQSESAG